MDSAVVASTKASFAPSTLYPESSLVAGVSSPVVNPTTSSPGALGGATPSPRAQPIEPPTANLVVGAGSTAGAKVMASGEMSAGSQA